MKYKKYNKKYKKLNICERSLLDFLLYVLASLALSKNL